MHKHTHTFRFDCAKLKLRDHQGKPITSFRLRETTGLDEDAALQRVLDAFGGSIPSSAANKVGEHVIADSFVEVNDAPVVAPFTTWMSWPSRTQTFVTRAFSKINGATEAEIKDFLEGGAATAAPGPESKPASD